MSRVIDVEITDMHWVSGRRCDDKENLVGMRFWDNDTKAYIHCLQLSMLRTRCAEKGDFDTGLLIASETGPWVALNEITSACRLKGYTAINPSYFPHIMPCTQLLYGNQALGNHGFASTMYVNGNDQAALAHAAMQLYSGRCSSCYLVLIRKCGSIFLLHITQPQGIAAETGDVMRRIRWRVVV